MSTAAMRLDVDRADASAVRLSITAAMVIAKLVRSACLGDYLAFCFNRPLQRSVNKG
jgi:hypothetical protein